MAPFQSLGGQSVFEVGTDAALLSIPNPSSVRIEHGVGYWVKSTNAGNYDGPVGIDRGSLREVQYATNIVEHALTLENLATATRTLRIAYEPSEPAPPDPPGNPTVAGDVPLRLWEYDSTNQVFLWRTFTTSVAAIPARGQAGSRRVFRLAVHRAGLSPAALDDEGQGSQYQGLLTITDGQGFRRRLPVAAQVPGESTATTVAGVAGGGQAGLYVGTVTMNAVSWVTAGARTWTNSDPTNPQIQPGGPGDRTTPRPASAEFVFPIIVHLDELGVYRALHEVVLMWRPGNEQAGVPASFVLVTPECPPEVLAMLEAGSIQDGEPFSRRLSSAAFYFTDAQNREADLLLTGRFGTTLQGTTVTRASDRLNPFRHRYHPDHDCNETGECFDVTRAFTLTFDPDPTAEEFRPGFNESYFRGTYTETITGLHRDSLFVRGEFQLARVSRVGRLNAQ